MIDKNWILAGKAIFTIQCGEKRPEGCADHYTFRVKHKPAEMFSKEVYFVSLMTGPDNTRSYTYMGVLDPLTGYVRLTAKSRYSEDSVPVRVFRSVTARLWKGEGEMIRKAPGWDVMHCGYCGKCGKVLTVPESVASGYGPECSRRLGLRSEETVIVEG